MSDEKFKFDKNNIALGVAAGVASTVLLSLAVPDTTRQFSEEVKERYLGIRNRHKGRHGHHRDKQPDATKVEQVAARREDQDASLQR